MPVINVEAPGGAYCCAGSFVNAAVPCVLVGAVAMPQVTEVPNYRKAEDAVTLPVQMIAVSPTWIVTAPSRARPIQRDNQLSDNANCASPLLGPITTYIG